MNCFLNQIYSHRRAPTNHFCCILSVEFFLRAISIFFNVTNLYWLMLIFLWKHWKTQWNFILNVKRQKFYLWIEKINFWHVRHNNMRHFSKHSTFKIFSHFSFRGQLRREERERASKNSWEMPRFVWNCMNERVILSIKSWSNYFFFHWNIYHSDALKHK